MSRYVIISCSSKSGVNLAAAVKSPSELGLGKHNTCEGKTLEEVIAYAAKWYAQNMAYKRPCGWVDHDGDHDDLASIALKRGQLIEMIDGRYRAVNAAPPKAAEPAKPETWLVISNYEGLCSRKVEATSYETAREAYARVGLANFLHAMTLAEANARGYGDVEGKHGAFKPWAQGILNSINRQQNAQPVPVAAAVPSTPAAPTKEPKREPLTWAKTKPFDKFEGYTVTRGIEDRDCFAQGHPLQRMADADWMAVTPAARLIED